MRDTTPKASAPVSEPSPYNDSDQGSTDVFNSGPASDDSSEVPKTAEPNSSAPPVPSSKPVAPKPTPAKPKFPGMATVEEIERKVLNAKPKAAMPPKAAPIPAAPTSIPKAPASSGDSEPLF
jgi:hypothetical protein